MSSVESYLFFFFSSRRRHTRCALVTGVQTCALPISGHMPPCLMKMGNGFQIFLENIAPTRQEQHRPARSTAGGRPVETTNSPAVRGGPIADLAVLRIGPAISRNDSHQSWFTVW